MDKKRVAFVSSQQEEADAVECIFITEYKGKDKDKVGPKYKSMCGRQVVAFQLESCEVWILVANEPGGQANALIVNNLLNTFDPNLVIMTGCCAGQPDRDQKLGDVIIAEKIIKMDPDKIGKDLDGNKL